MDDGNSWFVQRQAQQDFHWFQLIVWIRAWGLIQDNEKDRLKQAQELWSVLWALVQIQASDSQNAIFLEETLKKVTFLTLWRENKLDTSRLQLIPVDSGTDLTLSCFQVAPAPIIRWWVVAQVNLMGLFQTLMGNLPLTSFKYSEGTVCHYTVLNGTLKSPGQHSSSLYKRCRARTLLESAAFRLTLSITFGLKLWTVRHHKREYVPFWTERKTT